MISNAKIAEHVEAIAAAAIIASKPSNSPSPVEAAAIHGFVMLVTNLLQNINDIAAAARAPRHTFERPPSNRDFGDRGL